MLNVFISTHVVENCQGDSYYFLRLVNSFANINLMFSFLQYLHMYFINQMWQVEKVYANLNFCMNICQGQLHDRLFNKKMFVTAAPVNMYFIYIMKSFKQ